MLIFLPLFSYFNPVIYCDKVHIIVSALSKTKEFSFFMLLVARLIQKHFVSTHQLYKDGMMFHHNS